MKTNIDKAIDQLKSFKTDDNSEYLLQAKEFIDSVLNKRGIVVPKRIEMKMQEANNSNFRIVSRDEAVMIYLHNTELKVYQVDTKDRCVIEINDILVGELEDANTITYIIKQEAK